MKARLLTFVVSAATVLAASDVAVAGGWRPPMGQFQSAFYTCDGNRAFQLSYDAKDPTTAQLTTSNNSKQYDLTRAETNDGARFTGGRVIVTVSDTSVSVVGTEIELTGCKLKRVF